ncbi:unnamed protein product, partial [Ectocarpus sp. 12 AP-2014]
DSECAFVELKTHHEAWTGDKSVKRRFKIRNSELTGSKSKEDTGPPVDAKAAKTRKALIEKLALAQEVQRLVVGKRVRPLLVTEVR